MRFIAIGMLVLAGAAMAIAGTIVEALPVTHGIRQQPMVDDFGFVVVAIGTILLIAELFGWTSNIADHFAGQVHKTVPPRDVA